MTVQPPPPSLPSSPISTKFKHQHGIDPTQVIPIDDASRTNPIHPLVPSIKLPANGSTLNPLSLKPFSADDLKHHNYHNLRAQFAAPDAAARARDEAVAELKSRLEEAERRTREVEREMEEKEKTRQIERKVWEKRKGEGGMG